MKQLLAKIFGGNNVVEDNGTEFLNLYRGVNLTEDDLREHFSRGFSSNAMHMFKTEQIYQQYLKSVRSDLTADNIPINTIDLNKITLAQAMGLSSRGQYPQFHYLSAFSEFFSTASAFVESRSELDKTPYILEVVAPREKTLIIPSAGEDRNRVFNEIDHIWGRSLKKIARKYWFVDAGDTMDGIFYTSPFFPSQLIRGAYDCSGFAKVGGIPETPDSLPFLENPNFDPKKFLGDKE